MAKNAIVVGLGFAGCVFARELAEAGYSVLAYEKRSHIAGNMYEYTRSNGVRVHMYGPHIFHTNSKKAYDYLCRFSSFYPYTHRVLGSIKGKLVPIPFNYSSIDALFPKDQASSLKNLLTQTFAEKDRIFISELIDHNNPVIADFGNFVFENVFAHYSAKQWGVPVSMVDSSVINRVPVVLGTDDRYFSDSIQMMPINGYTPLFNNMLSHPNIQYMLDSDALDHINLDVASNTIYVDGEPFSGPICYSGAIDELFKYSFGALPYRSLDMCFENHPVDYYQSAAVINYPNEEEYTRITEFKHMSLQVIDGQTTILKEYPLTYLPRGAYPPYYPIINKESQEKYDTYKQLSHSFTNLFLCGRLAEYRYYNMDASIDRALFVANLAILQSSAE